MFRLCVILAGVLLPASVLCAPTVHLQDYVPESPTTPDYNSIQSVDEQPRIGTKPHVMEPTWITVTVPPISYGPTDPKPHAMPPYTSYVVVPPLHQPMGGQWPLYYPNMPVLPYQYPINHMCQQQMSPYRAT
ncbi:uncharacterized protein LOC128717829 [Anopheles marshallii]|uniref:uncharacterized protein LOC128717829 n=1 Tax=Anopheles marshallii TaxID=1521116 RepID=UPI00237BEAB5|nr:uncharacterized protein LOC128717829 [Anopheles marshallii]